MGLPMGVCARSGQGTGLRRQSEMKSVAKREGRIRRLAWMWPGARLTVLVLWVPVRHCCRMLWLIGLAALSDPVTVRPIVMLMAFCLSFR